MQLAQENHGYKRAKIHYLHYPIFPFCHRQSFMLLYKFTQSNTKKHKFLYLRGCRWGHVGGSIFWIIFVYPYFDKMTNYKLTLVIHENNTSKIKGHLLLATFVEQENYIIFSPQFDVCGYGKTLEAAKFSLGIVLGNF